MKLAVVGTRQYRGKNTVYSEIQMLLKAHAGKITHIVSGGCYGPDQFGIDFAKEFGLRYKIHEADWEDLSEPCKLKINPEGRPYNALAGFKRNTLIVEDADLILAFWDGVSNGTRDVITKARKEGKPLKIIHIEKW